MKKHTILSRTAKVTCLLLAVILSLTFLQGYVLRKLDHNMTRLDGYYRQEQGDLDVVLLGASEVYTGFSACRAYERYGFTSYPVATESLTTDGMMLALREIVRTQKPKLLLIEPNAYLYRETKNEKIEAHTRKLADNIPLGENKIDFINRCVDKDLQWEYYFPLVKYHDLWQELPKSLRRTASAIEMQLTNAYYLRGFRTNTEVFVPDEKVLNDKITIENRSVKLNKTLEKKMRELLRFCKEQELNVAFIRMPHMVYPATYERVKRSNKAAEIVQEYGYDYINLERDWEKAGIDCHTDFYNYDHLNIYGTVKLTDYLGEIVQNKYGISRHQLSGSKKESWDKAVKTFGKLYRYCDEQIKKGHVENISEDMMTLRRIEPY